MSRDGNSARRDENSFGADVARPAIRGREESGSAGMIQLRVDKASTCKVNCKVVVTEEVCAKNRACDFCEVELLGEQAFPSKSNWDRPHAPRAYGGAIGGDKWLGIVTGAPVVK